MKKKEEHYSATPDEYRATVEKEFSFLCEEYGFKLSWSTDNPFEAFYDLNKRRIRVTGTSYGFSADVTMVENGETIPFWTITTKFDKRFTPSTSEPQLDTLREYSYRLRNECADVLAGDLSRLSEARKVLDEQKKKIEEQRQEDIKGMFFSKADKLWKNQDYADLIISLKKSPYRLSKIWEKRLEYAQKKSNQAVHWNA